MYHPPALLADLTAVSAEFLKQGLLLLIGIGGGALLFKQLFRGDKPVRSELAPQPLRVQEEAPVMTRDMCETQHATLLTRMAHNERMISELRHHLEQVVVDLRVEMKADRDKNSEMVLREIGSVHTRVNQILEAVAELRGAVGVAKQGRIT